jgi:hypothetical protein
MSGKQVVYKIILAEGKTLFKGINGSRTIPFNQWLIADKKPVKDKYPDGKEYMSGFHVFLDRDTAEEYLRRFRKPVERVIVKCLARGLREKPTNSSVHLADELYIDGNQLIMVNK